MPHFIRREKLENRAIPGRPQVEHISPGWTRMMENTITRIKPTRKRGIQSTARAVTQTHQETQPLQCFALMKF